MGCAGLTNLILAGPANVLVADITGHVQRCCGVGGSRDPSTAMQT